MSTSHSKVYKPAMSCVYVGWAVQLVQGPVHGQRETFLLPPVQHGSTPLSGVREAAVRGKEMEKEEEKFKGKRERTKGC